MGQGTSTEVTQPSQKIESKELNEKGKEEEIKDADKTGSLRKKAWLKRKPSEQKSPKSKKKGKENKKKGSQDKLSITTEEPEKEEVSHRLSRIELHLEECQPAPEDDTISLSSCGENIENHFQDVISDDSSTTADPSSNICIANNLTDSISKDDSDPLNSTPGLSLPNENQEESNPNKTHDNLDEIHDLREIKGDLNEKDNQNEKQVESIEKQVESIEKQVESIEKQSDLIEKQDELNEKHDDLKETKDAKHDDLKEKHDDLKETKNEKLDDLKEAQVDLNEKEDDLKEVQKDLNEKKDDLKELQVNFNEKRDDMNENIHTSTIEVTEVCQDFKKDRDLLTEHSENDIPIDHGEEEMYPKMIVSSSENDDLKLPDSKRESETVVSTAKAAVYVDECQDVSEVEHLITSPQTNPDITFTNTQVTSANLEDVESHESKDECENSSLSLDVSSSLQKSKEAEIEMKDTVKQDLVEVIDKECAVDQVKTEIKSEPEVLPSNLVIQTEMLCENKDVNSEEIILNNGQKSFNTLEGDDDQSIDHTITHQAQIPNDDVSLDSKNSSSEKDENITEARDHFDDDIHHTSSMISESETVYIVESKHQDLSDEICPDKVVIQEDTAKLMDTAPMVETLTPDSSVSDSLKCLEHSENVDNEEPQYKMNLNERNMSDPEILLETIRMMEEAKAKGPSVEIMTTDLDAEDLLDETSLHPANNTEESKVNNIEINTHLISFQNSNTNVEEGSIGEPSDQSLAMSSTSTEQSDSNDKMKPAYTDNSTGTVFV